MQKNGSFLKKPHQCTSISNIKNLWFLKVDKLKQFWQEIFVKYVNLSWPHLKLLFTFLTESKHFSTCQTFITEKFEFQEKNLLFWKGPDLNFLKTHNFSWPIWLNFGIILTKSNYIFLLYMFIHYLIKADWRLKGQLFLPNCFYILNF